MKVESGWRFNSADFSIQAAGNNMAIGSVTLIRSPEEKIRWHAMPEDLKESDDCPPLIVIGRGLTLEDAIIDANLAAAHAKPIPDYSNQENLNEVTTRDLVKFIKTGISSYRYRVAVNFVRYVRYPSVGSEAYITEFKRGFWGYGKNQEFKSSKEAVKILTEEAKKYLHLCSVCEIIVWRGCVGEGHSIKDTKEKFQHDFSK